MQKLGIDIGTVATLIAVENTETIHNVVVCTLCSCYPRMLLGLPPDWYKSLHYRSRVVKDPRGVLKEFGLELPAEVSVQVYDSTADIRYLVIPARPPGTEHLSEDALAQLVTRDSMIGVTRHVCRACERGRGEMSICFLYFLGEETHLVHQRLRPAPHWHHIYDIHPSRLVGLNFC